MPASGSRTLPVALDAMGGDRAPRETVAGAVEAVRNGVSVILCGPRGLLERELETCGGPEIPIEHAPDVIASGDAAVRMVRSKPGSSLVTACRLVREGRAGAALSAGSTGAMLAASLFELRRVPGVHRPAIAAVLPSQRGPCVLIDAGANADARPSNLLQFAVMATVFAEEVLRIAQPRVGLLSIGEEASKGNALTLETHALLAGSGLNFAGNCEGRDALRGTFAVIVCDGFTGNVLLKGLEGTAQVLFEELRAAVGSSLRARLGGALLLPALRSLRRRMDPDSYGGAYLLGLRGLAVIAHGISSRRAMANALHYAALGVEADVAARVEERLAPAPVVEPAPTTADETR